jgi:hypothetical protein
MNETQPQDSLASSLENVKLKHAVAKVKAQTAAQAVTEDQQARADLQKHLDAYIELLKQQFAIQV